MQKVYLKDVKHVSKGKRANRVVLAILYGKGMVSKL